MTTRPFAAMQGWQRVEEAPTTEIQQAPPPEAAPSAETLLQQISGQLNGIQGVLNNILTELREQVQAGYTYPITVDTTGLVPVELTFDPALFSISLTNDGPGTIQYRIPNTGAAFWIDLQPTEVVTYTFLKGLVKSAGFRAQGADGRIRAVGTY
jgi:hypothetical protein